MKRALFLGGILAATLLTLNTMNASAQTNQAALDNIFSRKSVRSYTEETVTPQQVETMLRAAMSAPSGMNVQPWRFVVVTEQATKEKLAGGFNKMIAKAPVVFVVCGQTIRNGQPNGNWTADCAAAAENLLLAASGYTFNTTFFPSGVSHRRRRTWRTAFLSRTGKSEMTVSSVKPLGRNSCRSSDRLSRSSR